MVSSCLPNNPPSIKLDVENVAGMVVLKLPHARCRHVRLLANHDFTSTAILRGCDLVRLGELQIPHFDGLVVARADELARFSVKADGANEQVVARDCMEAFAGRSGPNLDLAVVGARNDVVALCVCIPTRVSRLVLRN